MAWSDRPDSLSRAGLLVVALTSALYLIGLDRLPIVLGGDEAQFAVHAESLARSGRDLNGTAFPVFIRIADPLVPNNNSGIWYQPLLFYAIAPFVKIFGVTEWAVRLPVALLAVLDTWLMYAIGCRMFRDRRYAVAAAMLLALTPAHIIVSRQALDYVAPLPFVLGWFLLLLQFLDTGRIAQHRAGRLPDRRRALQLHRGVGVDADLLPVHGGGDLAIALAAPAARCSRAAAGFALPASRSSSRSPRIRRCWRTRSSATRLAARRPTAGPGRTSRPVLGLLQSVIPVLRRRFEPDAGDQPCRRVSARTAAAHRLRPSRDLGRTDRGGP